MAYQPCSHYPARPSPQNNATNPWKIDNQQLEGMECSKVSHTAFICILSSHRIERISWWTSSSWLDMQGRNMKKGLCQFKHLLLLNTCSRESDVLARRTALCNLRCSCKKLKSKCTSACSNCKGMAAWTRHIMMTQKKKHLIVTQIIKVSSQIANLKIETRSYFVLVIKLMLVCL